jgi:hypothetical protein
VLDHEAGESKGGKPPDKGRVYGLLTNGVKVGGPTPQFFKTARAMAFLAVSS